MRTNRDFRLTRAIRLALGSGLAAAMAFGPVANAAEEEDAAELDRVQVTGSRISRLDIEGATPVVTIDREDLDNSGFQSVADYLRSNAFNSFGSIREESGNTAQGQATISLRGLGSNRTLILVDGKRMPGSPVLDGQIQNLNTIPFAAVERIEILSDGASAVYGSDAIGGVVNVILRQDFEGGEVTARATDPDRPGGAERGVSVVSGFAGDRGRVTFALEADHQDVLFSRDREFLANQFLGGDPANYFNYSQISVNARNFVDQDTGLYTPMIVGNPGDTGCEVFGDGFLPQINDVAIPGIVDLGDTCNYDYTKVAAQTAALDRLSGFMTAEYEINSDLTFTSQLLATRVESFGRYAPTAANFLWTGPTLGQTTATTADGTTVTLAEIEPGDRIYYRFNNTGAVGRDTTQTDYQYDMQVGLEGFHGGAQWNLNYQYDLYDMHEWGAGYVNLAGLNQAAANGWDPRQPNQAQFGNIVGGLSGNSNRRAQMVMQRVDVGAQFDGPMMDAGPMLFYVGGEYRDEQYYDQTLAQMEAGNVLGTAGGSSGGSRSAWAGFVEASVPVTDTFELNPAVRYDSYNDFGTNVSSKLAARWQPVDYFVLRGSFGTGFRAPSLDELYQAPAQSFSFAYDIYGVCTNQGANPGNLATCLSGPDDQYETFIGSNPELDAEESTQYLIGGVLDFNELNGTNLTLSLDYYYTEIDNVITPLTAQDAFWLEYIGNGTISFPGVSVTRNNAGVHELTQVRPINFSTLDTTGIDLRASYGLDLGGAGNLSFNLQHSIVLEYNTQDIIGGPLVDQVGRFGVPEYRSNLDISWNLGRWTVALSSYFIPGYAEDSTLNPNFDGADSSTFFFVESGDELDSYMHHNLVAAYEAPWDARISFGVNNVTDEDPVLDSALTFDSSLYPLVSRAYVASYTQRF